MARAAVPRESVVLRKRPTVAYRIIWKAIRARKRIIFSYDDRPREACPHIPGYKASGDEAVFVFQVGGESSKPLAPEGVDVNVRETLTRRQPLAFGSPALRPPRQPGE